ncbi:MAG: ABC transporter permease subunit [Oscillospiraceae bacterium]|jgi:multiple sugar transport system permease protein/putative aldouronate transport system permease protein|nr:ABC transporter permease subunit [Oscillospiraceae bacterium]
MNSANTAKRAPAKKSKWESYKLFLMIVPFLAVMFIFTYLPLYGWIYAFYDYTPPLKLSQCPYVGWKWFKFLFMNSTQVTEFLKVMRNTFAMSGLGILTSPLSMIFAIFLNEIHCQSVKKTVQTLTTLPNFISWVLVYSVAFSLFSSTGMVNNVGQSLGLISQPIHFLDSDNHTWLSMLLWGIWKGLGWGAIMYLASLASIDQELYEAAKVDGANRFDLIWHITIPGLLPTYFVLLMLSVANFLSNGLDQYYVFHNSFNMDHIQVLDLYVYNLGLGNGNYALSTALSMMKSIVSVVLLFVVNTLSKVTRGESIV